MMTERTAFAGQYNSEQAAPFPSDPDVLTDNPNIVESENSVHLATIDPEAAAELAQESILQEVVAVTQNGAEHIKHELRYIEDADRRTKLVSGFYQATNFLSADLEADKQQVVIVSAMESLATTTELSEHETRLQAENARLSSVAVQRSREIAAKQNDVENIESTLIKRKVQLRLQYNETSGDPDILQQIIDEITFIDTILERKKESPRVVELGSDYVPSTDELDEQVYRDGPEVHSPPRGIPVKKLAQSALSFAVQVRTFAHDAGESIKNAVLLDESQLDNKIATETKIITSLR